MKKNLLLIVGLVLIGGIIRWGMSSKPGSAGSSTPTDGSYQVVTVSHDGRSLEPRQILLKAGANYDIEVTPTANGVGCMFAATVPKLSSETWPIIAGKTFSIKIANARPGTYPVICTAMGMQHGQIVVQ